MSLKIFITNVIFGLLFIQSFAQKAEITTWQNNAYGAYSLILDDFGLENVHGIHSFADTMAYKRDIHFNFAIIAGQTDDQEWGIAKQLIDHGHRPTNHSWSHKCGKQVKWCTDMFGYWSNEEFALEIDSSTAAIVKGTGVQPLIFAFPFDVWEEGKVQYLMSQGYIGARCGPIGVLNFSTIRDDFRFSADVRFPKDTAQVSYQGFGMNQFIDQAISNKKWAVRTMHGVEDESWGSMSVVDFKSHLDYVKDKVDVNELWVAPAEDVIQYMRLRSQIKLNTTVTKNKMEITFGEVPKRVWLDVPLTLKITDVEDINSIFQNGHILDFERRDAVWLISTASFDPIILMFD